MKFFQPLFLVVLSVFIHAASAQEGGAPNCDAICNERVQQAVQPIDAEKKRAEEWGWGLNRELEEVKQQLAAANEQAQHFRGVAEQQERAANEARANLENAHRDLENTRREVNEIRHSSSIEIEELRTKAEEATSSLGRVQYDLNEAIDKVKEMESSRISVNVKGLQEDAALYFKNLVSWWTGLVMPEKKVKEEDL